jgi:hypothetical protein
MEVSGQIHGPVALLPGTHWMDPGKGLYNLEKKKLLTLPGLELRPLSRPARSQSLYRLHYPDYV